MQNVNTHTHSLFITHLWKVLNGEQQALSLTFSRTSFYLIFIYAYQLISYSSQPAKRTRLSQRSSIHNIRYFCPNRLTGSGLLSFQSFHFNCQCCFVRFLRWLNWNWFHLSSTKVFRFYFFKNEYFSCQPSVQCPQFLVKLLAYF